MDKVARSGALIVTKNFKKCLMVLQRKSGKWGIPKGKKEPQESYEEGMKREIQEEVGFNIDKKKYNIIECYNLNKVVKIYIISMLNNEEFECKPPLEDGKENHEVLKIEWVNVMDAMNRKKNFITSRTLNYFIDNYYPRESNLTELGINEIPDVSIDDVIYQVKLLNICKDNKSINSKEDV